MRGKGSLFHGHDNRWYVFTPSGDKLLVTSGAPKTHQGLQWCFYETNDNQTAVVLNLC